LEILAMLGDGLSNTEIARRLALSPKTVDHHVGAVLAKLDVDSRKAAAALAQQHGLVRGN
jgi:DNA-binding NarL/FixJ family response regulator